MKCIIQFGCLLGLLAVTLPGRAAEIPAFTNSLGLRFVSVPKITNAMFCVWLTCVQDFRAFVSDRTNNGGYEYTNGTTPWIVTSNDSTHVDFTYGWYDPGFAQRDDCPVVCVNWYDAKKFCDWLTRKERADGKISTNQKYRLPTDAEWSIAAGLENERDGTPADKSMEIKDVYAWGTNWPPPSGAGNFGGEEAKDKDWFPPLRIIVGYNDGFPRTSPVGSFAPDRHDLYDFTGNAGQWCEDNYHEQGHLRVWRGGNWLCVWPGNLWLSTRGFDVIDTRNSGVGFRLVLSSAP
ncbi:MAG TPA: SUMF1/EgtB/PvdO family nonheme iron enzyme [Verrucomicrobiae bacterium]